jgi:hypothetical protein
MLWRYLLHWSLQAEFVNGSTYHRGKSSDWIWYRTGCSPLYGFVVALMMRVIITLMTSLVSLKL